MILWWIVFCLLVALDLLTSYIHTQYCYCRQGTKCGPKCVNCLTIWGIIIWFIPVLVIKVPIPIIRVSTTYAAPTILLLNRLSLDFRRKVCLSFFFWVGVSIDINSWINLPILISHTSLSFCFIEAAGQLVNDTTGKQVDSSINESMDIRILKKGPYNVNQHW